LYAVEAHSCDVVTGSTGHLVRFGSLVVSSCTLVDFGIPWTPTFSFCDANLHLSQTSFQ
jgi:hypothetical protein